MNEVRIAACACTGQGGVQASLERAADMIDEACRDDADLICFPETFAWTGLTPEERIAAAEPLDGPFSQAMSKLAAGRRVNILSPIVEADAGRVLNTMAWFDRAGKIIGTYRKVFVTVYEMDQGFCPGPLDFDVFHTEFGPIGCCVCFDLNFPEVIQRIAEQKARLVVFPTMFDGAALMQAWAKLYRMYFLSVAGSPYGTLVDPLGKKLVEQWHHPVIMTATVNLDYEVLHTDENRDKFRDVKRACGDTVEIDNRYLTSSSMLASRHPEQSALDIVRKCGLELETEYYARSRAKRERWLARDRAAPAQAPPTFPVQQ